VRVALIAVGRLKAGSERDLFERYFKRASDLARRLGLQGVALTEIDEGRATRAPDRQVEEARAIAAAIPKGAKLILLDERGKALTSPQFASDIAKARDSGVSAYAIVIGGADGLTSALRDLADNVVSFGAMTWPHQLARVMAAEQLYRALSIIAGHPYHRE
jgi:23S rRNA (pseudouridine1915-N3)-methyltransferase